MAGNIGTGLQLMATAVGVGFTVLIAVTLVVGLFQRRERNAEQPEEPMGQKWATQQPLPLSASYPGNSIVPESSSNGVSPEIAAIIASAVTVALDRKVRIKRVRYRGAIVETAWSRHGRYSIMTAHAPRRYS